MLEFRIVTSHERGRDESGEGVRGDLELMFCFLIEALVIWMYSF
jgi:hypothetical protein